MMRRLAASIVERYPLPWRERYANELLALIEDSPPRVRDLGELVRGLLVERARALIEDADHPARTATILSSMQPVFVIAFMAVASLTGWVLRAWRGPLAPGLSELGIWTIGAFVVAFFVSKVLFWRRQRQTPGFSGTIFPAWAGLALLPILFVGIALTVWGDWAFWTGVPIPGLRLFFYAWTYGMLAGELSAAFWPGQQMLQAFGRLAWTESQVKSARTWVEGCNTMIAQGVPSPLAEAQAQFNQWSREREAAFAQLQQLGYRARFAPEHIST